MDVREWLLTISMIGHFANMVYGYIERRNDKTNEKIADLTTKIEALEDELLMKIDHHIGRVTRLEAQAESSPNHGDLNRIHARIDDVAGQIKHLAGEFSASSKTIDLIHDYLMRGKK